MFAKRLWIADETLGRPVIGLLPGCLGAKSIYLDFLMFESFIAFVS